MNAPGKGLLKAAGILLIVYGSLSLVIFLFVTAGSMFLAMLFGTVFKGLDQAMGGALLPLMLAGIGLGAADLALGIAGLRKCSKPSKGVFFLVSAAVLCLLHTGFAVYMGAKSSFFLYYGLVGIIFAAMYVAGGIVKRRGAAAARGAGM